VNKHHHLFLSCKFSYLGSSTSNVIFLGAMNLLGNGGEVQGHLLTRTKIPCLVRVREVEVPISFLGSNIR
jgi:hypothetical protein